MEKIPSQDDIRTPGLSQTKKRRIFLVLVLVFFVFVGTSLAFFLIEQSHDEVTAIFLTCCNRYSHLNKTLQSFFTYNDYPLEKIILLNDG
jgi:capsular polysaccharide biosynthesis protein